MFFYIFLPCYSSLKGNYKDLVKVIIKKFNNQGIYHYILNLSLEGQQISHPFVCIAQQNIFNFSDDFFNPNIYG